MLRNVNGPNPLEDQLKLTWNMHFNNVLILFLKVKKFLSDRRGGGGGVRIKYLNHNLWLEFSIICWTLLILLGQSSWQVSVEITKINQSINNQLINQSFRDNLLLTIHLHNTHQSHERDRDLQLPSRCLKQSVFIWF